MRTALLSFSFLLSFTFIHAQKSEAKKVTKAFEGYRSAILNDKGAEAVRYVDSNTVKYYVDMLELVKTADSATVEELSILDKLMVFSIRHRTPRENILSFDGKALLVYAIESGMVGKSSVANISIGEVTINENFATGQLVSNGEKAPFYFHFHNEDEQWKVDLTSIFAISTTGFQRAAKESGKGDNEFIFSLLEMITGKKPDGSIWEPVK